MTGPEKTGRRSSVTNAGRVGRRQKPQPFAINRYILNYPFNPQGYALYSPALQELHRDVLALLKGRTPIFQSSSVKGLLLHGPNGTGKTEYAYFLAEALRAAGLPIELLLIEDSHFRQEDPLPFFDQLFAAAEERASQIGGRVLILLNNPETVFHKKSEVLQAAAETGSALTNLLEGKLDSPRLRNVFFIFTTNNLSNIEVSLYRPGRLGAVEFGKLVQGQRRSEDYFDIDEPSLMNLIPVITAQLNRLAITDPGLNLSPIFKSLSRSQKQIGHQVFPLDFHFGLYFRTRQINQFTPAEVGGVLAAIMRRLPGKTKANMTDKQTDLLLICFLKLIEGFDGFEELDLQPLGIGPAEKTSLNREIAHLLPPYDYEYKDRRVPSKYL